jgi:hypothetical protein
MPLESCKVLSTKANESTNPSSSFQFGNSFLMGLGIKGVLRILPEVHHSIMTASVFAGLNTRHPKHHRAFHVVNTHTMYNRDLCAELLNETSHAALKWCIESRNRASHAALIRSLSYCQS